MISKSSKNEGRKDWRLRGRMMDRIPCALPFVAPKVRWSYHPENPIGFRRGEDVPHSWSYAFQKSIAPEVRIFFFDESNTDEQTKESVRRELFLSLVLSTAPLGSRCSGIVQCHRLLLRKLRCARLAETKIVGSARA